MVADQQEFTVHTVLYYIDTVCTVHQWYGVQALIQDCGKLCMCIVCATVVEPSLSFKRKGTQVPGTSRALPGCLFGMGGGA